MKHNYQTLIILIGTLLQFAILQSQNIDAEGDLSIGGGDILFTDDINGGSPKVISIQNQQGDFSLRTLGSPGSEFRVDRDHGFLFKNVESNQSYEFFVNNSGHLLIRDEALGDTIINILDGVRFLGINGIPNTELTVFQMDTPQINGAGSQITSPAGISLRDDDGSQATLFIDNANDLNFAFNTFYRSFINDQTGEYVVASDRRFKQNIISLPSILEVVRSLRPTEYEYKGEGKRERTLGFIAQEVEQVMPSLVSKKGDSYALAYDQFSVLAIKAIQEQQDIIDQLTKRLEKLEANQ